MEEEKKVDNTTTDTHTETVEKVSSSDNTPAPNKIKSWTTWALIGLAILATLVVTNINSCANSNAMEKQVVEKSKLLKATSDSVKALGDEVVKTTNELNALDAKYQDSLDNAMYSEEFRMLDSLAKEFHDKNLNKGGSK